MVLRLAVDAFEPTQVAVARGAALTWENASGAPACIVVDEIGLITPMVAASGRTTLRIERGGEFSVRCPQQPAAAATVHVRSSQEGRTQGEQSEVSLVGPVQRAMPLAPRCNVEAGGAALLGPDCEEDDAPATPGARPGRRAPPTGEIVGAAMLDGKACAVEAAAAELGGVLVEMGRELDEVESALSRRRVKVDGLQRQVGALCRDCERLKASLKAGAERARVAAQGARGKAQLARLRPAGEAAAAAVASMVGVDRETRTGVTASMARVGVPAPVAAAVVRITREMQFRPMRVRVRAGQAVRWEVDPDDEFRHVLSSAEMGPTGADEWESRSMGAGDSFQVTFRAPGLHLYRDVCFANIMWGEVEVLAAGATEPDGALPMAAARSVGGGGRAPRSRRQLRM